MLVFLFPDEVIIPKNANVYYAMVASNKDEPVYFILRKDPT